MCLKRLGNACLCLWKMWEKCAHTNVTNVWAVVSVMLFHLCPHIVSLEWLVGKLPLYGVKKTRIKTVLFFLKKTQKTKRKYLPFNYWTRRVYESYICLVKVVEILILDIGASILLMLVIGDDGWRSSIKGARTGWSQCPDCASLPTAPPPWASAFPISHLQPEMGIAESSPEWNQQGNISTEALWPHNSELWLWWWNMPDTSSICLRSLSCI